MKRLFITLAGLLLLASHASAATRCAPREAIIKALQDKFQETERAVGIASQTALMEVFASKAGTWTIILSGVDGLACVIASGTSYEEMPPEKGEKAT